MEMMSKMFGLNSLLHLNQSGYLSNSRKGGKLFNTDHPLIGASLKNLTKKNAFTFFNDSNFLG